MWRNPEREKLKKYGPLRVLISMHFKKLVPVILNPSKIAIILN